MDQATLEAELKNLHAQAFAIETRVRATEKKLATLAELPLGEWRRQWRAAQADKQRPE